MASYRSAGWRGGEARKGSRAHDDIQHERNRLLMEPLVDAAMNPPVGVFQGKRFRLSQTSLDTVGIMLSNKLIPTKLRLGYLHSCLFRSSTPPGDERTGPHLIDWDECVYCSHENPMQLHGIAADECGCLPSNLPDCTAEAVRGYIIIMDALAAARETFDWSLPASQGEQEVDFGINPNSSLVGEILAEFEHSWKVMLLRIPGHAPHGTPGHLPSWWTSGGLRAAALKANHAWLTAFRGTGAKGARPLCGEVDRNDDVFNATGWLLQSHRLAEIQTALAAVPPGEPTVELAYDDEGLLRLLPKAGGSYAGGRGGDEDASDLTSGGYVDITPGRESCAGNTTPPPDAKPPDTPPPLEGFAVGQHVQVHGLASRADLNGRVGEVLPPGLSAERYPVRVGDQSVRVRPANLRRTGASDLEGQIINGRVMVFGEWFSLQAFMEMSDRHGKAFVAIGKAAQADVMAGRREL